MPVLSDHIRAEHKGIQPHLNAILTTAHAVGEVPVAIFLEMTEEVIDFLAHELLPHAQHEDDAIYTAVEQALGAIGATNSMKREHVGIRQYVDSLIDIRGSLKTAHSISEENVRALRRILYGLHALITMHLTVEEDVYLPLLDTLSTDTQKHFIDELSRNGHH